MRYWWVNHKQTFEQEIKGYIWCPKRKRDGTPNHFYETIREVQQGDLVFSYAHAHLQAVGVAKLACYSCPRPVDHLFDRGFISFGDDGEVLRSPVADPESLQRMGIVCDRPHITGRFNSDQKFFLQYHRDEIFLRSAL